MWFLTEQGTPRISLNRPGEKVKNLSANPACTLFLLDLANPYRYREIRGDAEIAVDPDDADWPIEWGRSTGSDLRHHDRPGETRVVSSGRTTIHAVDMSR